jgi:hypothetical protein
VLQHLKEKVRGKQSQKTNRRRKLREEVEQERKLI